ncbi:hypothetical protein L209DRAFT_411059 [Thermothelomyces heterothallicus CBS 203.75]
MMRLFASSLLLVLAVSADDCQPATWNAKRWEGAYNPRALKRTNGTMSTRTTLVTTADTEIQPGDVNCRYSGTTSATVNYYTCTQMATKYGITVDDFFTLNPTLELGSGTALMVRAGPMSPAQSSRTAARTALRQVRQPLGRHRWGGLTVEGYGCYSFLSI